MKTIEIKVLQAVFRSKCHYRLKIDSDAPTGGACTPWSTRSAEPEWTSVLLLNQSDNKKVFNIVVEALVLGEPKVIAQGSLNGDPLLKVAEGTCELPIGTLKLSYKHVKQNVLETLSMASNGNAINGLSIGVGLTSGSESKFADMKIKVRNSTQGTVYGQTKLTFKKPSNFIQLDENQSADCIAGNCLLSIVSGEGENKIDLDVPVCTGSSVVLTMPYTGTEGPDLLTICVHLLSESQLESGAVHDIETTLEWIVENEEEDIDENILEDEALALLRRPQVMHMVSPQHEVGDLLTGVVTAPCDLDTIRSATKYGMYTCVPLIDPDSRNDEARINARMLANHRGTMSINITDHAQPLELKVALLDVGTAHDSEKHVTGTATLFEVSRVENANNGFTSVLEGDFEVVNADLAAALKERNIMISTRIVVSILCSFQPPEEQPSFDPDSDGEAEEKDLLRTLGLEEEKEKEVEKEEEEGTQASRQSSKANISLPGTSVEPSRNSSKASLAVTAEVPANANDDVGSSGDDDDHSSNQKKHKKHKKHKEKKRMKELDPKKKRRNHPEELPGLSELEDVAHNDNMADLYSSFDELYDEMGSPEVVGASPNKLYGKRSTKAGTALAHVIKAELLEKQRLINRLMDEAGARCDAIELCGKEIRALREEVTKYKSKADDATNEISKIEALHSEGQKFVENTVGSPEELSALNRATLMHVVLDLGERLKKCDKERVELKKIAMEGQAARSMYVERQQQLNDLTEAHMHQSHFIQKLQKKINKMDNYKSTIKLQENIIAKMQRVIEAHLKLSRRQDGRGSAEQNELFDKLMTEIERSESESREEAANRELERAQEKNQRKLEAELQELTRAKARLDAENATLKAKLQAAEDLVVIKEKEAAIAREEGAKNKGKIPIKRSDLDFDTPEVQRIEELEVENTSANYRIEALEEQLEKSAHEYGSEIARLRTRLFDFEMAAMLAEANGEHGFQFGGGDDPEQDDFLRPMEEAPAGTGADAAKQLSRQNSQNSQVSTKKEEHPTEEESEKMPEPDDKKEEDKEVESPPVEANPEEQVEEEEESWHEHEPVTLPIIVKLKKKPVGNCDVTFKFRYFGKLGQLEPGHEMEVIVTKVELRDCLFGDKMDGFKVFCDLSFSDDVWNARTKTQSAASSVTWNFDNEEYGNEASTLDEKPDGEPGNYNHQMRFKGPFSICSTENMLCVVMVENDDTPNELLGSGHGKLVELTHCLDAHEQITENAKANGEELPEHPGSQEDHDVENHSPRPVPTGKLRHNMTILNAALKVIGKTMAYADFENESSQSKQGGGSKGPSKSASAASLKSGASGNGKESGKMSASNSAASLKSGASGNGKESGKMSASNSAASLKSGASGNGKESGKMSASNSAASLKSGASGNGKENSKMSASNSAASLKSGGSIISGATNSKQADPSEQEA